jgi:chlorobactene glucosyltransferase
MFWLALSTAGLLAGLAFTWWLHRHHGLTIQIADRSAPLPASTPAIAVAVPARNEARNIGRCVAALLAQTYPNYTVTVLDDRSTDATPAILAGLARQDGRLRVLLGEPLPPGWAGKPHALVQAVAGVQAEWLCFVDADTFAEPHLLAAAYITATRQRADLFTILTRQRLGSFWEKAVMPLVFSALTVGFPPQHVNDPRRPEAVANGQFILIRRAVYEALGGHAALRASITEDKDLAVRVKRAGYRLVVADGRTAAETRMYTSLPELWEGWTKNIYLGLRGQVGLLLLGIATGLGGALLLTGWPLAGLIWLARGGGLPAALVTAQAALLWAYIIYQRARVLREMELSPWWALTLPIGALIFTGMMLTSTLRVLTGKGVTWKGRTYAQAGD